MHRCRTRTNELQPRFQRARAAGTTGRASAPRIAGRRRGARGGPFWREPHRGRPRRTPGAGRAFTLWPAGPAVRPSEVPA
jgi:hypothetical protein